MKRFENPLVIKIIVVILSALAIVGFFYFEPSITLRVLICLLGFSGIWFLGKNPELSAYLVYYLVVFDSYNVHYGFSIPLSILMIIVFLVGYFLFVVLGVLGKTIELVERNVFVLFGWVIAFISLEFFAVMDFWPINPMTKALILAVTFFLFGRLFYLFSHNMLSLKRALGYIGVALGIFGILVILNLKLGL